MREELRVLPADADLLRVTTQEYVERLQRDVVTGIHTEMLFAFLATKVRYDWLPITQAHLEYRAVTAKTKVARKWFLFRLWLYRMAGRNNYTKNWWSRVASDEDYPSKTAAGFAAVAGHVIKL